MVAPHAFLFVITLPEERGDLLPPMVLSSRYLEFVRFVIVGVVATVTHYAIYLLLLKLIDGTIAYSLGYLGSFVLNFFLSASFTFRERGSVRKVVGFALSHLANYLIHISLLWLFIGIGVAEKFAPIPVFAIAVPINFLMVRFVFRSKFFAK